MTTTLERLVEPLAEFITVESAAKIAALRADEDSQQLLDRLAKKANLGVITSDERAEYDRLLAWFHVMTIVQARARQILRAS
jgi:hypothetical protein